MSPDLVQEAAKFTNSPNLQAVKEYSERWISTHCMAYLHVSLPGCSVHLSGATWLLLQGSQEQIGDLGYLQSPPIIKLHLTTSCSGEQTLPSCCVLTSAANSSVCSKGTVGLPTCCHQPISSCPQCPHLLPPSSWFGTTSCLRVSAFRAAASLLPLDSCNKQVTCSGLHPVPAGTDSVLGTPGTSVLIS